MTIIEAIKSGKPIRRNKTLYVKRTDFMNSSSVIPNTWIDPEYFLSSCIIEKDDILATDWEVKPDKVKKSEIKDALRTEGYAHQCHTHLVYTLLKRIFEHGVEE